MPPRQPTPPPRPPGQRQPTLTPRPSGQRQATATGVHSSGFFPSFRRMRRAAGELELGHLWRWIILAGVTGAVAGLVAAGFYFGLERLESLLLGRLAGFHPPSAGASSADAVASTGASRLWLLALLPALGGLGAGLLTHFFAPEAAGHGTDAMIDAYHNHGGRVRPHVPLVKAAASLFTISFGGSAGREGPISQIAGGFGSYLAQLLRLSDRERRLLLLAGAAGGIGAIFRIPLGAAIFCVEVLYRDEIEGEGFFPCVISSVTAYSVFTSFFGTAHLFQTAPGGYAFHPGQLPFYGVMAVGCAALGLLWISIFYRTQRRIFAPMKLPGWAKPVLGGLLLGGLGLALPEVLGGGYGWVQEALLPTRDLLPHAWRGAGLLFGIALAKMVATSLTVSSGGSGGIFGPSIVIGGLIGGGFGEAFHELAPSVCPDPGAFVLVGMAAFFGGVAHVPISSLIMVSELTGSYDLLVPLMLSEAITFALLRRHSLYEKQVRGPQDSPAHLEDFTIDILEQLRVGDVLTPAEVAPVRADLPLTDFLETVSKSAESHFAVVDQAGDLVGVVSLDDLREVISDQEVLAVGVVGDAMRRPIVLSPTDSLRRALARYLESGTDRLPVTDPLRPRKVLGFVGHADVIAGYNRELLRRRAKAPRDA